MFNPSFIIIAAVYDRRNSLRIHRRHLRDTTNPFELPDERFREIFRFTKEVAKILVDEISPYMQQATRTTFVPIPVKVCAALHFYASGSYRRDIGQDFLAALSKTMVHRALVEVSSVVQNHLMSKWISFPNIGEYDAKKLKFYEKTGFPGVIGAVDCTHVCIKNPGGDVEHCYVNRKGYFSKNVQLICDYDLNILGVFARFAGASHDSYIWETSRINSILEQRYINCSSERTWLLGDSGYPLKPWLITPFKVPANESERRFNFRHSQARNCIERLNGVLKSVFRCLHIGLMTSPKSAGKIINACCVLHNFRRRHGLSEELELEQSFNNSSSIDEEQIFEGSQTFLAEARRIRENLMSDMLRE